MVTDKLQHMIDHLQFIHRVPSTELVDAYEFDDVTQRDFLVFEGVEKSVQSEPTEAGTDCTDDSKG